MTREDIVRLWDEANNWGIPIQSGLVEELERFAALVAAAEREACAKVAEAQIEQWVDDRPRYAASECAAAIRARGQK